MSNKEKYKAAALAWRKALDENSKNPTPEGVEKVSKLFKEMEILLYSIEVDK